MNKVSKLIIVLFFLCSVKSFAATEKYRLMIHDDPAATITIAWNQLSGSGQSVYYGTTDHGTNWADYPFNASPYRSTNFKGMSNQFVILSGLTSNTAYYFVIKDSEGRRNQCKILV